MAGHSVFWKQPEHFADGMLDTRTNGGRIGLLLDFSDSFHNSDHITGIGINQGNGECR